VNTQKQTRQTETETGERKTDRDSESETTTGKGEKTSKTPSTCRSRRGTYAVGARPGPPPPSFTALSAVIAPISVLYIAWRLSGLGRAPPAKE